MQLNLINKSALITGASQGIGKEIAIQLAKEGVRVVITSNDEINLQAVAEEIRVEGGLVKTVLGDVTSEKNLQMIYHSAMDDGDPIDILINNIGSIGRLTQFENLATEEWMHLFKLNVMSGVILAKLLIPSMRDQHWGRILFISSEKAIEPGTHLSAYSMTKAAILSVAKSLANEFGKDGITVNCVSPGVILTPAWDENAEVAGLAREDYASQFCQNVISKTNLGTPQDVAMLVCYLCSDLARWITGSNVRVDGGSVKSM